MKHLEIKISGQVQGVFFRSAAREIALNFNIAGFARNERDGTVYIEAEGKEADLKKFLDWCYRGPAYAKVEKVEYGFSDILKGFKKFEINY